MRKTEVPQLGHVPLTAAFPFLSVTFWGFLISMFALHLTQYACGIPIQLSAHWNAVVFETHVELGDTHEGRWKKKQEYWFFHLKKPGMMLVHPLWSFLGLERQLQSETSSIISVSAWVKLTIQAYSSISS
jgi:hypothetical protein